ncbi:unnamed protein product [Rhizophagus irregularis]|uniref:Uncharacterized protein n=1 Tax=Rhizophagus irregularis TaxID=588596 RepID=A0A2I1HRF9_9GLOM|nr:hypothetical protein RhiirA4_431826 [Rhizophagus irregularis]CAB4402540.1 unnamed protein product [Rhizophagus irregularis]CAB4403184.1 unnamed protein product [Rhizophagus irregularis]
MSNSSNSSLQSYKFCQTPTPSSSALSISLIPLSNTNSINTNNRRNPLGMAGGLVRKKSKEIVRLVRKKSKEFIDYASKNKLRTTGHLLKITVPVIMATVTKLTDSAIAGATAGTIQAGVEEVLTRKERTE